jgi:hypothetical protein
MGLFCCIRYIIDSRIEGLVTLDRLTSIPMPHRGATPTLRPRSCDDTSKDVLQSEKSTSGKNMSSIEWLKAGLKTNCKGGLVMSRQMVQQGWLNKMLLDSGVIIAGEKAKKERCFSDFQSQLLYIEGMKAVLGDSYDPRHAARAFGKNGKYKPTNKWKNDANPVG